MAVAMDPVVPSSAGSMLSLLEEPEPELQAHALRSLEALVDAFWPEISEAVPRILELSEDSDFGDRNLAALVAAKVLFHLGELDEALKYALAAGELFDVGKESEFAGTLRSKCIDEYVRVRARREEKEGKEGGRSEDDAYELKLEGVVERLLAGCVEKGEIKEALGVALEARRLDRVEDAIMKGCGTAEERADALSYCFHCAQSLVAAKGYRMRVVRLIAELYSRENPRDEVSIAACMAFVKDAEGVAEALVRLVTTPDGVGEEKNEDSELIALQIAFDIVDNDEPHFASEVSRLLSLHLKRDGDGDAPDRNGEMHANGKEPSPKPMVSKIEKLQKVLDGSVTASLFLDFLCRQNHSDIGALSRMQTSLEARLSVCHSALVFANACAHAGTAIDTFLRDNLDWLSRATAWAKFSATAGLGVIHARHSHAAISILSPYLPTSPSTSSSPTSTSYSEGGALYALGLITACGGGDGNMVARKHIMDILKRDPEGPTDAQLNEVVTHGACLGIGLASMATFDGSSDQVDESEDLDGKVVYAELKERLMVDSAVGGEAAGLAMGLVALGSGSDIVVQEMLSYARETQHEKITRGLAMGIALVMYGREEEAEFCIEDMVGDRSATLRYGACFAVALAYCGTGNNSAIRRLLHLAVADVADEVRRAAVISLGFVMLRQPEQVPEIVALLSESCHDHVRYGAAMAIGIACAGSGLPSAVTILNRLSSDSTDFVRQGAMIAQALVYMHHTEARSPDIVKLRQGFEKTVADKHEEAMARLGASLAIGLIDVGGKNGSISLTSGGRDGKGGALRVRGIVGMVMFTQMWYWFSYVHFIGLSVRPAALIGLVKDLKMVRCEVGYTEQVEGMFEYVKAGIGGPGNKKKNESKTLTAVLSVTAKSKARALAKAKANEAKITDVKMENAENDQKMQKGSKKASKKDADGDVEMEDAEEPQIPNHKLDGGPGKSLNAGQDKQVNVNGLKSGKPKQKILSNPCRVLSAQEPFISWEIEGKEQRYFPVKRGAVSGIVMLKDTRKGEPQSFVDMKVLASPANGPTSGEEEVAPPEPFEYTDEDNVRLTDLTQKRSNGTARK